ncbi:MAG TPA: biotin/lipoyl-containing protein [Pyrinomonadaceae bacterium]
MKLKAEVNAQVAEVTITGSGETIQAEIDGRSYEVKVHESNNNSYLLIHDSTVYDCRVENAPQTRESFNVSLRNRRHTVAIVDPRRLRTDENSDRHHHGPTELAAQMPGKVVRVLVEVGAKVEKGSGIIVVEAMKMQNEMKSPRAGVVASINVTPGDTVNAGEVLATIGDEG